MTQDLIRAPLVAGYFYPENPRRLAGEVDELYRHVESPAIHGRVHAVLVPHAGYMYSGQVAAAGYAVLPPDLRHFFIAASNHRGDTRPFRIALPAEQRFATPLGDVRVDPVVAQLLRSELFSVVPEAHASHIIEVQLPFLQRRYKDFEIAPIVMGAISDREIREAAKFVGQFLDASSVLIVSSDLSHYHCYEDAVRLDNECIDALESMDESAFAHAEACGFSAAQMLMLIAKQRGWKCKRLAYANSGDTCGDWSRVVGYGALAWYEPVTLH